jgi:beta-lactamase class A
MIRTLLAILLLAAAASAQTSAPPQTGEKQQLMWQKIGQAAHDAEHDLDGVLAVAVTDLKTGERFDLHGSELMPTASTIKIAVLAELYHQTQLAQQGGPGPHAATLATQYVFDPKDLVPDSFILGGLTPGVTRLTLRDVATAMIAVSDNSATNVLIDRVGLDNFNRYMVSLGYPHIQLKRKMMDIAAAKAGRENAAAPAEINALLEQIYNGKVFNKELTDDFLKMLSTGKDSAFNQSLPDGVRIADKPGALEGVRNDCGIIYAARPFALCVMTTYDRRERDAERVIGQLALRVYSVFDRLGRGSDLGRTISVGNSAPNP